MMMMMRVAISMMIMAIVILIKARKMRRLAGQAGEPGRLVLVTTEEAPK